MADKWEKIWITFAISLISFIAYSSQIFIIWPFYGKRWSIELLRLLVPFNVLVGLIFWCYYLCVTTEPGRIPPNWEPDLSSEDVEVKKLTGGPRFCSKCSVYKPPRAHHCRRCKRCVLRMDHHCPWVANCIGHHNYASFVRFLTYVVLACTYHFWMMAYRVWDFAQGGENTFLQEPTAAEVVLTVLNFVACVPVLIGVSMMAMYHYWSLWSNTTTIEAWEKDKVATLIRRGRIKDIRYPYSISPWFNIISVLGSSPLAWLFPWTETPGDGLSFEIADGTGGAAAVMVGAVVSALQGGTEPQRRRPGGCETETEGETGLTTSWVGEQAV
ncbi:zf-dhhc-domain-containing protein [Phaffia rhodozyma]|uniref:Palmitoyltransferase n=1 Tax=Phaffia rhodozyma TaxID=264483 RepID=A0A0F7SU14_PHARH|nr:zf-dhhc-domain-containing protein [Phaffia rhodozyma]